MPITTIDRIYRYVNELSYAGVNSSTSESYGQYLISLANLREALSPYYRKDENGAYPKMNAEDIARLRQSYRQVFSAGAEFEAKIPGNAHGKALSYVAGKINHLLFEEFNTLSSVMSSDSVDVSVLDGKAHTYSVDLGNQAVQTVTGAQSVRIPVEFEQNGRKVVGYFTESKPFNAEKETEELIERAAAGNEEYAAFLRKCVKNEEFLAEYGHGTSSVGFRRAKQDIQERGKDGLSDTFSDIISTVDPEYNETLVDQPDFGAVMFNFVKDFGAIRIKKQNLENIAKVKEGSVLEERNAAMSAVADLLGASDVIARSVKMEVKQNGRTMQGVFMEKAVGADLHNVNGSDPLSALSDGRVEGIAEQTEYRALRQMADIQALDFICGNVDRHLGNLLYTVEKDANGVNRLTGVQGIDHDCSFGTLNAGDVLQSKNRLVGLDNIHVMNKDTADRIMGLTPDVLRTTLKNYHLSEAEMKACFDRTKLLQDKIARSMRDPEAENTLKICEAKDVDILRAEAESADKTLFSSIMKELPSTVNQAVKNAPAVAEEEKAMAAVHEKLASNDRSSRAQGALTIEEMNIEAQQQMKNLSVRLKKVNTGLFISSDAFDEMKRAFENVQRLEAKPEAERTLADLKNLGDQYKSLAFATQSYLGKKEKDERDLLLKGKIPSETAKRRVEFAENMSDFAEKQALLMTANIEKHEKVLESAGQALKKDLQTAADREKQMAKLPDSPEKEAYLKDLKAMQVAGEAMGKNLRERSGSVSTNQVSGMLSENSRERVVEDTRKYMDRLEKKAAEKKLPEVKPRERSASVRERRRDLSVNM